MCEITFKIGKRQSSKYQESVRDVGKQTKQDYYFKIRDSRSSSNKNPGGVNAARTSKSLRSLLLVAVIRSLCTKWTPRGDTMKML